MNLREKNRESANCLQQRTMRLRIPREEEGLKDWSRIDWDPAIFYPLSLRDFGKLGVQV